MRSDRSAIGMIDKIFADQERRHDWLFRAGEQIRQWKEEESSRDAGAANNRPATDK